MKNRLLLLILIIFITIHTYSQNNAENKYYSRYEGIIDSSIIVTANIVRLYDNLSGTYNYVDVKDDSKYGNSLSIVGTISNNEANLKEFGSNESMLSGTLNKESFIGKWNYNYERVLNIEESYPMGSVQMDVYYLHSEDKLKPELEESPLAEIELTLIYPLLNSADLALADSVKHIISDSFFGDDFYDNNPDTMLTNFESEYYSNYHNQNDERYDGNASFSWQKNVNMTVINNSENLLSVEYLKYAYSGGAQGMTNISFNNIDLKSGSNIEYNDIFKEDSRDSLSILLTNQLYLEKKIPADTTLNSVGYFVNKLEPNHNFYINVGGIGFLYNSYEIAPSYFGQTNVFLEFDKVVGLLKKDSPITHLLN